MNTSKHIWTHKGWEALKNLRKNNAEFFQTSVETYVFGAACRQIRRPSFVFGVKLFMSLLASQCRAARAMLGFSQRDLAKHAEVAHRTIADFETGSRTPHPRTLKAIRETLEKNGVVFIDSDPAGPTALGAGVRLRAAEVASPQSSDEVPELSSGDLEQWWDELTPDNNSHKT